MLTKTQEAKLKAYAKTPREEQASLIFQGLKSVGPYWFLPMAGFIDGRSTVPLLLISGALLRIAGQTNAGTAAWMIPVTDTTREAALTLLLALGWDKQIWPYDGLWPSHAPEAEGLMSLMKGINIVNTLTFTPDPKRGQRVLKIVAAKTSGRVPHPIDVPEEDTLPITDEHRMRFNWLLSDPSIFFPSGVHPHRVPLDLARPSETG